MNTANEAMSTQTAGATPRWRLLLARGAWVTVTALALAVFILSIPPYYAQTRAFAAPNQYEPAAVRAGLAQLGLSTQIYFVFTIALVILIPIVFSVVGMLIFWRKPDDLVAWFFSLTLVTFGVIWPNTLDSLPPSPGIWPLLGSVFNFFGYSAFFLLFYLFPDGRFIPRWTRFSAALFVGINAVDAFASETPYALRHWPQPYGTLFILALFGTMFAAPIYRYRTVSDALQRQQTKWVTYGLAVALFSIMGTGLLEELSLFRQPIPAVVFAFFSSITYGIVPLAVPITIGIAVLRYHLWDIDFIIRRTVLYSVLTALLAVLYFASLIALQAFFPALVGRTSILAVAATTLAIPVLGGMRQRMQGFIDRRFFRLRYDTARTLAAFSATVRDEVNLTKLTAQLEAVVQATVAPTKVLCWMLTGATYTPCTGAEEQPQTVVTARDPLVDYLQRDVSLVQLDHLNLDSPGLSALRAAGWQMVVPLVSQHELIGWLSLGARRSGQGYSNDDGRLLSTLAAQVAPAVRVAQLVAAQQTAALEQERLEHELRLARNIQQSLLPKEIPNVLGWQMSVDYRPAHAVGGDFYDFVPFEDGRIGLIIGDVSGKGMPAALVMATTRSLLHSVTSSGRRTPGQVLQQLNELLQPDLPPTVFVTCLYAILQPATGALRYANAGHNLPYRASGSGVSELRAVGMPLGLLPDQTYVEQETVIEPGACLLFYSDGLTEAHNAQREMFGGPRVQNLMAQATNCALQLKDELLTALVEFTGDAWQQEDDITLVVLYRQSEDAS